MKQVMNATRTILEAMPTPNQRMTTGANATAGTLFEATISGMASRSNPGR